MVNNFSVKSLAEVKETTIVVGFGKTLVSTFIVAFSKSLIIVWEFCCIKFLIILKRCS